MSWNLLSDGTKDFLFQKASKSVYGRGASKLLCRSWNSKLPAFISELELMY